MKLTSFGVAVIEGDTHLSAWIEQHKTLEIARDWPIALYKNLIPSGGTVIDVGACLGDHTATYAKLVGPMGKVVAVEVNPVAYECLEHNMKPYPWVHTMNIGYGDKSGYVGFTRNPNEGASAIDPLGATQVPIITMDSSLMILGRVDFIKIDAEGYEPFILDGGKDIISLHKPHMFIEINEGALNRYGKTRNDVFLILDFLGYDYTIIPTKCKWDDPQYDIICKPQF